MTTPAEELRALRKQCQRLTRDLIIERATEHAELHRLRAALADRDRRCAECRSKTSQIPEA